MPQGAVKKKSTAKSKLQSSNRPLGPKKGKHTAIAPKKKNKIKQNKTKKELEKAIRGRIEEEITAQASKTIKNFTIVKPTSSVPPSKQRTTAKATEKT